MATLYGSVCAPGTPLEFIGFVEKLVVEKTPLALLTRIAILVVPSSVNAKLPVKDVFGFPVVPV